MEPLCDQVYFKDIAQNFGQEASAVAFNYVLAEYLVELYQQQSTEDFKFQVKKIIESWWFFYQKYKALPSQERVSVFHRDVDEIIQRQLNQLEAQMLCSKGCSSCCSQPVFATRSEVQLMLTHYRPLTEMERIKIQAAQNMESWTENLNEQQARCVFLNASDGSCRVWTFRPANCRNYFVSGSNQYCSIFERNPDLSLSWKSILADVAISAFYTLEGGVLLLAIDLTESLSY